MSYRIRIVVIQSHLMKIYCHPQSVDQQQPQRYIANFITVRIKSHKCSIALATLKAK